MSALGRRICLVSELSCETAGAGSRGPVTRRCVDDQCSCSSNTPPALQCPSSSADHDHSHPRHPRHHQPIYCHLVDGGVDESLASGSIDVQFQSSATSTMTSDAHPLPQLARWKPVANIPERWSKEILRGPAAAAAAYCESATYFHLCLQSLLVERRLQTTSILCCRLHLSLALLDTFCPRIFSKSPFPDIRWSASFSVTLWYPLQCLFGDTVIVSS